MLLAISASSPYLDGATPGCTRRARRPSPSPSRAAASPTPTASWQAYRDYLDLLIRTSSIVEYTQVWWSVRPHFSFGTVEVRICDAQTTARESEALAALIVACVAQAARDHDEGVPFADPPRRLIEENLWRAIRFGLDGTLIDFERAEVPGGRGGRAAAAWTAPVRAELGSSSSSRSATAPSASAARSPTGADARGLRRGRARDRPDLRQEAETA